MIVIQYVENVFKQVWSTATKGAIQIGVMCKKNAIVFSCSNHFQENKKDQIESHQIGHELIEKRIEYDANKKGKKIKKKTAKKKKPKKKADKNKDEEK